jgi:hypothetical protein
LLGDVSLVARRLAELLGAARKDCRGVRFGNGKGDENPNNAGKDELDPVQPAPASAIGKVATNKRADCFAFGQ